MSVGSDNKAKIVPQNSKFPKTTWINRQLKEAGY